MKTKQHIIATLIAMVFTTTAVQAQSARRPASQEREKRTEVTKKSTTQARTQTSHTTKPARQVQTRQVQQQRNTQPARKVQTRQVQQQRNTQPARKVQTRQVQQQRNTQPARKVQTRQVQQQRNTQPARKVQTRQVKQQRNTQPARQVQTRQVKQQRNTQPARQVQTRKAEPQQAYRPRTTQKTNRPVSITTSHNPKSTYRKPESKAYVNHKQNRVHKENKFSNERYYTGNHYHNAYPTHKVKLHYHYDTHAHNYHVLYYPSYTNIYWNRSMYRNYRRWYPEYSWNYNYGHRINTISVFDAKYNLGEVANVYGRVYATWHNEETNDYLLFFGGDFPYQQFTVVVPARIARKFSWRPERYFLGEHITITGLITTFDGSPEIVVRDKYQIGIY